MNVDKADAMLRKSLKWREENNIDQILEWKAPEVYSQLYPIEFCGHDKYGCPSKSSECDVAYSAVVQSKVNVFDERGLV